MAIMGRDPFGIFQEGEVHTISYIRCNAYCSDQYPVLNTHYRPPTLFLANHL
jgi:hypothetical protein